MREIRTSGSAGGLGRAISPVYPTTVSGSNMPPNDLDGDGYELADDCDDDDAAVNSGVEEIPYDGIDNDCDEVTPDDDLDGDGYAAADDCDDSDSSLNFDDEDEDG